MRDNERTINQVAHMGDHADDMTRKQHILEPCSGMCNNECVFTA